ncbi:hypothetical protein CRG98_024394, partial [Punica granatum]
MFQKLVRTLHRSDKVYQKPRTFARRTVVAVEPAQPSMVQGGISPVWNRGANGLGSPTGDGDSPSILDDRELKMLARQSILEELAMLRNLTLRNWYGFCHYASMQHTLMPHPSSMAYSSVISDDDPANNSYKRQPYVDEKDILNELSDLLAVPQGIPVPYLFKVSHATTSTPQPRAVDMFLSPEEKLRGVFLQKLKGRTAIECALNNAGIDLTEDIIARVVNKGNLGGEAMVIFFRWAIRHPSIKQDTDCYNLIIKALGRRKYFDYMEKMLCEMGSNGIRPSLVTLSIVLDSFLRARHVSKAIEFFGRLGGFGWEPNTETLNVLLQCLCQRFHVGAANRFLNSVKDRIPFNATTYNTIISGWSKSGRVGEIKRVLEGMSADGFSPDFFTFSYLIEGFGRAGQIDEAVEIFSG